MPLSSAAADALPVVAVVDADLANFETRDLRDSARRTSEQWRARAPDDVRQTYDLSGVRVALAVAKQHLCDARRENNSLRANNERLRCALIDASLRGTENRRLAHHDSLTGLPNRLLLKERLQQAVAESIRLKRDFALLFVDIDGFKFVNDSFGHATGDQLLKLVAARIAASVRVEDVACRYGGDEFVILLSTTNDAVIAARTAAKIRRRIGRRFSIDGREFRISASVGLAFYPQDGERCDQLLASADASMYRDKAAR